MINKIFYLIFYLFFITHVIPNEYIDNIINGKLLEIETINFEKYNINDNQLIFINGLLEVDGKKAKDNFIKYFNSKDNLYDATAAMKIAEYYYSKGSYLQSSDWFKKIPLNYSNSKHLDAAIDYYLNSLIIVGRKDTANYYTQLFNKKFKKSSFNNKYLYKKKNNSS